MEFYNLFVFLGMMGCGYFFIRWSIRKGTQTYNNLPELTPEERVERNKYITHSGLNSNDDGITQTDVLTDLSYSHLSCNIHHHEDTIQTTDYFNDPSYSSMPGNIYHHND